MQSLSSTADCECETDFLAIFMLESLHSDRGECHPGLVALDKRHRISYLTCFKAKIYYEIHGVWKEQK
jgi:hypothetical protein